MNEKHELNYRFEKLSRLFNPSTLAITGLLSPDCCSGVKKKQEAFATFKQHPSSSNSIKLHQANPFAKRTFKNSQIFWPIFRGLTISTSYKIVKFKPWKRREKTKKQNLTLPILLFGLHFSTFVL